MSIGRDAAPAYSEELRSSNIARTTSTYDVDRLGEFTLSYKKKIGRHHIDALAGYTLQKKTYDRLGVEATGFADDRIHEVTGHGSNASDISLYSTRKAAWAMMSFLTRVNYSFDDRYTLTGSFRADGSSRFGIDSRWGYFPSVSAGWTLSNEPFLKDALKDVASIRLRASWGKSGNNDIGNYASLAGISSGSYAFGQTPVSTTYEGSFTDAALGWETTRQTNVGIDLGFFNGRLNVIGNWYNSISTDILYKYPISSISGATSTTTNMSGAKIRNRGFDVQLDARLLTGKVNWNFSTNISVNRNKVVSMGGLDDIISTTERSVGSHITKEGKPIGSFYGYQAVGIMSKADYANALLDRDVYIKNGNKFPEGYQLKGPAVASYALDNLSYGNAIGRTPTATASSPPTTRRSSATPTPTSRAASRPACHGTDSISAPASPIRTAARSSTSKTTTSTTWRDRATSIRSSPTATSRTHSRAATTCPSRRASRRPTPRSNSLRIT